MRTAYPLRVKNSVTVYAPAKINLALRVGSPRPDGFHPLNTVFCSLDLYDVIDVEQADELSLELVGCELEVDEHNLALRAARALQTRTGTNHGARITITKTIPVAGGMAGGSANAAGVLVGLNELWDLGLTASELAELGSELGSDVPFCLMGGLAIGTSRGENLVPIRPGFFQSWVLIVNDEGMSTPAVFKKYDELRPEPHEPASIEEIVAALQGSSIDGLVGLLVNDLAEPAFHLRPDIRRTFERAHGSGIATVLSGSGPTIAILCTSDQEADVLAEGLRNDGMRVLRAVGPAVGPHIVRSN